MSTPVISGNVSFYNESDLGEVLPTPLIGMLGVLEHACKRVGVAPSEPADLYLLYTLQSVEQQGLGASTFLAEIHGIEDGYPEAPDVAAEKALCEALAEGVEAGAILGAHDLSDGGLAVAAAEIAVKGLGVSIRLPGLVGQPRLDAQLFGEIPGRVLAASNDIPFMLRLASKHGLGLLLIGSVKAVNTLRIETFEGEQFEWSIDELRNAYEGAIPRAMSAA